MRWLQKIIALKPPWSFFSMMILSINSFIIMLYRNRENHDIVCVVVFMVLAYLITMPLLNYNLKNSPKSHCIIGRVNKGFRVFYTGISLTAIILNMINTSKVGTGSLNIFVAEQQDKMPLLIFTAIMGLSCFWTSRLTVKLLKIVKGQTLFAKLLGKNLEKEKKK